MAMGPNYVLDKGHLATGGVAYAYGDLCKATADGKGVAKQTTAGGAIRGVCQENIDAAKVATGKAIIDIRLLGIVRVTAGAAILADAQVACNASNQVIPAVAGNFVVGVAMKPAAAAGDIIEILLTPGVKI